MKTEEELQKIGEEVVEVICEIYDPEIPVNIYHYDAYFPKLPGCRDPTC